MSGVRPGWTLTGQADDFVAGSTTVSSAHLGWTPGLVAAGSDAEGGPAAGPPVAPRMQAPASGGLAAPGALLASAGSGLGTRRAAASMVLWIPDTAPTGTYVSTLTLTLIRP